MVAVMDRDQDRYLLQEISERNNLQISRTLAHLQIANGKIRIEFDATERGIATDPVAAGIPKDRIVLAFYPPALREMGEFSVA
ncbi:MAG: element excision factor XisI family protein [Capsulimonadales bacterium]|nr:element excision factor XisI family protein [Capsulimonadales bacterium]